MKPDAVPNRKEHLVLLAIAALLVLFWIAGLFLHLLGAAIHVILVLAVVAAIAHFFRGSGRNVGVSRGV